MSSSHFFSPQVQETLRHLQDGRWCAIIAPRFSGKSTMAGELIKAAQVENPGWKMARVSFVTTETLQNVWQQMEHALCGDDAWEEPSAKPFNNDTVAENLDRFLAQSKAPVTCLLMDQLDNLPDELLRLLADELRRFYNADRFRSFRNRFRCVLFGSGQLAFLSVGHTSPLEGVVHLTKLRDLTADEAAIMFKKKHGGEPDAEAREELFKQTSGHRYLIDRLALMLKNQPATAHQIQVAGAQWSRKACGLRKNGDRCVQAAIRYLERSERAFRVVLGLLEGRQHEFMPSTIEDPASMSGALREIEGGFQFRGAMFEGAMRRYFDDLRKADCLAMHGDWQRALQYYAVVDPKMIRKRRKARVSGSRNNLLDLCMELTRVWMQGQDVHQIMENLAQAGCYLFGADQASLWEWSADKEAIVICASTNPDRSGVKEDPLGLVGSAIRHQRAQTLADNRGIIQNLGTASRQTAWALELLYDTGLPGDEWLKEGLRFASSTFSAILDLNRRHSEADQLQTSLVHQIVLSLQGASTVKEVLALITDGVRHPLGYECAQITLTFEHEGLLRAVESNGAYVHIRDRTVRPLAGDDVLAIVVKEGKHRIISDCADSDSLCDIEAIRDSGLKSQVIIPLKIGERTVGALQVGNTKTTHAFSVVDLNILRPIVDQAAVALESARQREAVTLALQAAGNAMAFVDAGGVVRFCNEDYSRLLGVRAGDQGAESHSTDFKLSFSRGDALQRWKNIGERRFISTVAALKDEFGRYGGGIEVIGTRSPLYPLVASLEELVRKSSEADLAQAIVDSLTRHFGFARARLYRVSADGKRLLSPGWSSGCSLDAVGGKNFSNPYSMHVVRACRPVVIMRGRNGEPLPLREETQDMHQRRVLVLEDGDCEYLAELGKLDMAEWLDIPLGSFAKVSVDHGSKGKHITLEEMEVMGFFSRLATESMARVVELDRAKKQQNMFRSIGQRDAIETVVRDYLISITHEGGTSFNRAAFFLRQPQSQNLKGFMCHGAPDGETWRDGIDSLRLEAAEEKSNPADHGRNQIFQSIEIRPDSNGSPFSQALASREPQKVIEANVRLKDFYEQMDWQPTSNALIYPLMVMDSCEALVYVDYAFINRELVLDESTGITSINALLASALRVHRRAERLKAQVQGLSHASIAPMAAVHGLAENLRSMITDSDGLDMLDAILAESRHATDTMRCFLRFVEISTNNRFFNVRATSCDVGRLLRESMKAYRMLMEQDSIQVTINIPKKPIIISADPTLLGLALAEMAANAMAALKDQNIPATDRYFSVCATVRKDSALLDIEFRNAGVLARPQSRDIFEPYVSGTGSTGIGLSLVREIVRAHDGQMPDPQYGAPPVFNIHLPLPNQKT